MIKLSRLPKPTIHQGALIPPHATGVTIMSIALHVPALLAMSQAVPFTHAEATSAQVNIAGRYTRDYLRKVLKARRMMRAHLKAAIAGGHIVSANDHAIVMHSVGVQAVLLIRRLARHSR